MMTVRKVTRNLHHEKQPKNNNELLETMMMKMVNGSDAASSSLAPGSPSSINDKNRTSNTRVVHRENYAMSTKVLPHDHHIDQKTLVNGHHTTKTTTTTTESSSKASAQPLSWIYPRIFTSPFINNRKSLSNSPIDDNDAADIAVTWASTTKGGASPKPSSLSLQRLWVTGSISKGKEEDNDLLDVAPRRILDSRSDTNNGRQPQDFQHPTATTTTLSKRTPRRAAADGDHDTSCLQDHNHHHQDNGTNRPLSPSSTSVSPTDPLATPGTTTTTSAFRTPNHHHHHHPHNLLTSPSSNSRNSRFVAYSPRFFSPLASPPSSARRKFVASPTNFHHHQSNTTNTSTTVQRMYQLCKTRQRWRKMGTILLVGTVLVYAYLICSMFLTIHNTTHDGSTSMDHIATSSLTTTSKTKTKSTKIKQPTKSIRKEKKKEKEGLVVKHQTANHATPKKSHDHDKKSKIKNEKEKKLKQKNSPLVSSSLQPRVIRLLDIDSYHKISFDFGSSNNNKTQRGHHANSILSELDAKSTSTTIRQKRQQELPAAESGSSVDQADDKNEILLLDPESTSKTKDPPSIKDECLPQAKWQTDSFVNCNLLHELDMILGTTQALEDGYPTGSAANTSQTVTATPPVRLDLLGQGWFRSTWKVETAHDDALVLKTLRLEREFLEEYYELHRRDAVAMERLTFSPFVMNVYGYCGQSALNELANFKDKDVTSLEALSKRLRGQQGDAVSFVKLRLATSIATGLAHVHEVNLPRRDDNEGRGNSRRSPSDYLPAMAHYDLNPRNIAIVEGGNPKLNDFNIAEFLKFNPNTNTTCGFNSRLHEPWWRAPEEMNNNHTHIGMSLVNEKVDVYALGNVLYHVLTTHSPRGKMKRERMDEVRALVRRGIAPTLPEEYYQQAKKDIIFRTFIQAMELCFVVDPQKRGTARQVADLFRGTIQSIKERQKEKDRHGKHRHDKH